MWRRCRALVVVASPTDLPADRSEDPQDRADHNEQHADGPQDGDVCQQAEDQKHDAKGDHGFTLSFFRFLARLLAVAGRLHKASLGPTERMRYQGPEQRLNA